MNASVAKSAISFQALESPASWRVDPWMMLAVIGLVSMGFMMISSASVAYAEQHYGNPLYHTVRHSMYLGVGLVAALVVYQIPMAQWEKYGWVLLLLGAVLLMVVLVPGVSREVNGSRRWIVLPGFTLQASEVAKFCMIVYLAGYLVRRRTEVQEQWRGFIKPVVVLAAYCFLLYLEPDFGALVVLVGACLGMLFLAGLGLVRLTLFFSACMALLVPMVILSPYRLKRVTAYIDPWADQFNGGYQLTQSLIAIGRGEWFGVGLGNSVQKLFYLPEAHTDFVFAIFAEEFGLVGTLVVLALFALLVARCLVIARKAECQGRLFAAYTVYGFTLILAAQAFINMGVNSGLLPTKGLTLPFLSYGGSSLIMCCVFVALIQRVHVEGLMHQEQLDAAAAKPKRAKKAKTVTKKAAHEKTETAARRRPKKTLSESQASDALVAEAMDG